MGSLQGRFLDELRVKKKEAEFAKLPSALLKKTVTLADIGFMMDEVDKFGVQEEATGDYDPDGNNIEIAGGFVE